MRFLLSLLLVFLLATPVSAQEKPDWIMRSGFIGLAAVSSADMTLTGKGLALGLKEQNPILKPFADSPVKLGIVKGALSGAVGLGAYALHKKGKKKEARIFIWTMNILTTLVVFHNAREIRKAR